MQDDEPPRRAAEELDRWRTPGGTELVLRPVRPDDEARELRFLDSLSPQTLYERTFSHRKGLAPGELLRLVRFDVREEIALVAVIPDRDDEFAAVVRLRKSPDGRVFEFAIVVGDAWQRQGIGARLLGNLLEFARAAGIERVVGSTFATNEAMKCLARKAGFALRADPDDPTVSLLKTDL